MPVSLEEIGALANGAHFLLADLHVHSFGGSRDVSDDRMSVSAIIDAAVAKGVGILSITDHNSAINLRAAADYAQRYAGRLLFIPGVELTTAHGHLLAYFEDHSQVEELLTFLQIKDRSTREDGHTSASMADAITRVESLGGVALAAHIDRLKTGFETRPGYQTWKRDIIMHRGLYGFECDDSANLTWYGIDDVGLNAAERTKLYLARKNSDVRWQLAHVQSSDSHDMDRFISAEGLTRVKVDEFSFNAFLLAFKDPTARVRANALVPTYYPRIIGASIDGGFLGGQVFHFSPNLNCLFGGRGTGKSTAIRAIAHTLGVEDSMADRDDCPESIALYVEDANGSAWCYRKEKGVLTAGFAADDPANTISPEAFPIEYYAQNDLARVSESLTVDGALLQDFLDRHLELDDLREKEQLTRRALRENAAILMPIEASFAALPKLQQQVVELDKKLKAAEKGKLKDVAAAQAALGNERQLLIGLRLAIKALHKKLSLDVMRIDFDERVKAAEPLVRFKPSPAALLSVRNSFSEYSASVDKASSVMTVAVRKLEADFNRVVADLEKSHVTLEQRIDAQLANLRKAGLKGSIDDLRVQIRSRSKLADQAATLLRRVNERDDLRANRAECLEQLHAIRVEWERRRKDQLVTINRSLDRTVADFKVHFLYENAGDQLEYFQIVSTTMHGDYLPDEQTRKLCAGTTPQQLKEWLFSKDEKALRTNLTSLGIEEKWGPKMLRRFSFDKLLELEEAWKPPSPRIRVLTKTNPPRELPVSQLSDGQRHTILLTVAMLSDSYFPLIIDQPEDDLDNAFIFSTVVNVLREVKEKRQVIVVTHNANIAVLGDSELLFPMRRHGDVGTNFARGSIDREDTRVAVQQILEGGRDAFIRRAEMYHLA